MLRLKLKNNYPDETKWFGSTDAICFATIECHVVIVVVLQEGAATTEELHLSPYRQSMNKFVYK